MPFTVFRESDTFFVAGGNLMPDAGSYVVRPADDELFDSISNGHYSYVLTSRQMGKSSLMHKTAIRLQDNGITPVLLDLTSIGANLTLEQWYFGLMAEIGAQLDLKSQLERYWTENALHGPLYRFTHALSEVVLANVDGPVAIFIDEIDFIRGLRFSTDEFFAAIRHCHNNRAADPSMQLLTFCLLGVATPADLIRDVHTTPFNIGRQIELTDFSRDEAAQLEPGLSSDPRVAEKLLDRIMYWTGGHPYLTQKMCLAVSQRPNPAPADVDRICHELFLISGRRSSEDNLIFVHNTLRSGYDDPIAVITRYRQVLTGKEVPNDPSDPVAAQLRLAGVVKAAMGRLRVRNRIYGSVFNRRWVEDNLPDAELRREKAAYRRGLLTAIGVSVAIVAVMAVLFYRALAAEHRANIEHTQVLGELAKSNYMRAIGDISQAQEALEEPNIPRAESLLKDSSDLTKGDAKNRSDWSYLWHQCHGETNTFKCSGGVLAVSPTGRGVAAVSDDGVMRIWSGQSCRTISLGITPITAAFSADSRELAVGTLDGTIKIVDVPSGHSVRTIYSKTNSLAKLAIASDRRTLVSQGSISQAEIWDIHSANPINSISRPGDRLLALAVTGDGRMSAAGFWSGYVVCRAQTPNNRPMDRHFHIPFPVTTLSFSSNSMQLAIGDFEGGVYIYDMIHKRFVQRMRGRHRPVICFAFSPTGKLLLSGGNDTQIHLWNVNTGDEAATFSGHATSISCLSFDRNPKDFISGSVDGDVKIWNPFGHPATIQIQNLDGPSKFAYSFVGDRSLVVNTTDGVQMWDLNRARLVWRVPLKDPQQNMQVDAVRTTVVIDQPNGMIEARSTSSGRLLHRQPTGTVGCYATDPDGVNVAVLHDTSVYLWNIATGRVKACYTGAPPTTQHLVFSPDGKWLAAGGQSRTIRVWNLDNPSYSLSLAIDGPSDQDVTTIVFDRSSTRLAAASDHLKATAWSIPAGRTIGTIALASQVGPGLMLFSPDSNEIVTGDEDGGVKMWDLRIGSETVSLNNDPPNVVQLHLSADGSTLSALAGDFIRRWRFN